MYCSVQLFARLQSMWKLSLHLHTLENSRKIPALPVSLQQSFVAAVSSTVLSGSGLMDIPSDVLGSNTEGANAAIIKTFQRAEPPPITSFAADPFRFDREELLNAEDSSDSFGSLSFARGRSERKCCVYYKLSIAIPSSAVPIVALLELSPEYPERPPQFLLTSRQLLLNASVSSGGSSVQIDNGLKAIESEVNAGCLSLLHPAQPVPANRADEILDATLSFQFGLLLVLLRAHVNSGAVGGQISGGVILPSKKRGRNRRAAAIQGLYGRQPF